MRVLIATNPSYVAIYNDENDLILQGNSPELLEMVRVLLQKGAEMGVQISVDSVE